MNFESVHNYYEPLVIQEIMTELVGKQNITDEDFLEDVACVALNSLPARYVRHDVDMAFFLTTEERHRIAEDIRNAISNAHELVISHREGRSQRE